MGERDNDISYDSIVSVRKSTKSKKLPLIVLSYTHRKFPSMLRYLLLST